VQHMHLINIRIIHQHRRCPSQPCRLGIFVPYEGTQVTPKIPIPKKTLGIFATDGYISKYIKWLYILIEAISIDDTQKVDGWVPTQIWVSSLKLMYDKRRERFNNIKKPLKRHQIRRNPNFTRSRNALPHCHLPHSSIGTATDCFSTPGGYNLRVDSPNSVTNKLRNLFHINHEFIFKYALQCFPLCSNSYCYSYCLPEIEPKKRYLARMCPR
jgi:hypothetical protein